MDITWESRTRMNCLVMTHSLLTSSLDDPLQGWVFGVGVGKVGRLGEEGILQTNKKRAKSIYKSFL